MQIEQSEVYDKVWLAKLCVCLLRRRAVTNLRFFGGLKHYFKQKKPNQVSRLTIGYLWAKYEKF